MKNNEKGFALVLSLVLLLVMPLMGGSLIVVSSGDHKSNNLSDKYQQAFYVAETALLEGEKYVLNQFLGPYTVSETPRVDGTPNDGITRDRESRNLPGNQIALDKDDTKRHCSSSFSDLNRNEDASGEPQLAIVSQNSKSFNDMIANITNEKEKKFLKHFVYEYFVLNIGSAPFRGYGSSIKKGASDEISDGMAYRVYGCGMYKAGTRDEIIVPLESVIVLPN